MRADIRNPDGSTTVVAVEDGNLITGTISDATVVVEDAKARHRAGMFGDADMKHAARIDRVILESYLNMNRIDYSEFCQSQEHMSRLLNNPDFYDFRIWKGRV